MAKQKQRIKGAVALVLDLAKGIRACQPPCGLRLGDSFQFAKEDLASAVRLFRAPAAVQTISAILPGYKWSCLLLQIVLQDALRSQTFRRLSRSSIAIGTISQLSLNLLIGDVLQRGIVPVPARYAAITPSRFLASSQVHPIGIGQAATPCPLPARPHGRCCT